MDMFKELVDPPEGYANVRDNRRHRISCRTWLVRALSVMQGARMVVREGKVENVEAVVRSIGEDVERRMGEGEDVDTFIGEV